MPMSADIPRVEMEPSPWVRRFADLIPENGAVLDLACGAGRHARYLLSLGFRVLLLDRNITAVADLAADEHAELIACDLEDGRPWPLGERTFDGVLVTNYLYRPLMKSIVSAVAPGGVLIYETFATWQSGVRATEESGLFARARGIAALCAAAIAGRRLRGHRLRRAEACRYPAYRRCPRAGVNQN